MKIALYSKFPTAEGKAFIAEVIRFLKEEGATTHEVLGTPTDRQELSAFRPDFLFSIGGDGTFIDAANIVGSSNIPILGINTGRIGFLTNINRQNFKEAYKYLKTNDYQLEKRILLHVESDDEKEFPAHFALNDISVHPSGESINAIQVWADGEKVNTYWGDGVIVPCGWTNGP